MHSPILQNLPCFEVIIAGSRWFSDYELAEKTLDIHLQSKTNIIVISGRCDRGIHTFTTDDGIKVYGADGLGERYAKEKGHAVKPFYANWTKYGNAAGPIRNEEMAKVGHALSLFWDGQSTGSKSMLNLAKQYDLLVRVKMITPTQ